MTDYQPLLARALKGLDRNTSEARRAVYDRARQALLNQLRSAAPPMADADITRERLALEDAIRKTETEAVMAEPHSVRAPSAARIPAPPRTPAPPPPASARPSPRIPVAPRIPMPPAAPQPQQAAPPPPPPVAEAPEQNANEREAKTDISIPPPPSALQPRGPLPSANPLRARAPKQGNGADAGRENREESAPEARASGLPSPELLEELKAELEPPQSPLPPPAQRFERPRPPQRPRGEAPGGGFPPPPPPGARPRPPRGPGQRPPGPGMPPGAARVKPPKSNLWKIILAGFAALLIVAAGVLAFTMRGRTPSGSAPQPSVADTDAPKTSERIAPSQQDGQGRTSAPSNLDPTVAQRAVLYEENPGGGQQFQNFVGTAVWRTEAVNAPGRAPDLGLRIEVEIPERKINVTLKMRRNTDPSFPASHTIEVIFSVPAGDAFGGVADMRGIRAKGGETAQGNPIAAEVQKVKEGYFLLALPKMQEDANLSMLRERDWLDVPFVYANGRRAVLTFQKGTPGERALREVLNSWGQGQGQNQTTGSQ